MKRARSPSRTDSSNKRARCEQECFFFSIPSELRVLVRAELGVDDRHRLSHTCHAAYAEEAPGTFDFPSSWLRAIALREPPDDLQKTYGTERPPAQIDWVTDGDMARAIWALGWHRWPGMVGLAKPRGFRRGQLWRPWVWFGWIRVEIELRCGTYDICLAWSSERGMEATGMVPRPCTDIDTSSNDWAPGAARWTFQYLRARRDSPGDQLLQKPCGGLREDTVHTGAQWLRPL